MRAALPDRRRARLCRARIGRLVVLLAGASALAVGCGSNTGRAKDSVSTTSPGYVTEPFTPEQHLVEKGARLVVAYGCSACHLNGQGGHAAPSFTSLAGGEVELDDGRRVLVDESFLRESMRDPARAAMKGYDADVMVRALARLHLGSHPRQVEELAAFIEQVGPETG
jgi:hypothetical protein